MSSKLNFYAPILPLLLVTILSNAQIKATSAEERLAGLEKRHVLEKKITYKYDCLPQYRSLRNERPRGRY